MSVIGHNIKYVYYYKLQSKNFESHWIKEMNLLVDKVNTYFKHPNPFFVYIR